MTISISELRERVSLRYPRVEQISDTVLFFTRSQGDNPFAICYIDIASKLPGTKESLNRYQDHLIGKRYFDSRKSLQWSNYLYFLCDDEVLAGNEARQAKELIESDRTYARKFVISEEEIDSILVPHIVSPADDGQYENVLSTWIELLTEAGIERAILSDESLPARLSRIEANAKDAVNTSAQKKRKRVKPAQFLSSLELAQYRNFPVQRRFDFGLVNLRKL